MLKFLFDKIYQSGVTIANLGVTPDLSFHDRKKTQIFNFMLGCGVLTNIIFFFISLYNHKPLLITYNVLMIVGGILILLINRSRKFLMARLALTFMSTAIFTLSAVVFRNGGEYYLMLNLVVIIIYFDDRKYLITITILNCALFILVKYILQNNLFSFTMVTSGRMYFNIGWALVAMTAALLFFKNEQKAYHDQIEEKNRELKNMNETKEKLFSIISHDLRSPIGQLKNSLDLVNSELITPESFQQISVKLSSEVERLNYTLDNLLKWSISQLQGIKAMPQKVSLASLLEKKQLVFRQIMEQKNISLVFEEVDQYVWVDPDHLLLVLRNLISNSIKYCYQNGTILIKSKKLNQHIIIDVIDNGTGMSEEVKNNIFLQDNIVSNTGTANEKGTGLGLKLCKEFVEKNDGEIWVTSTEGKGSCFSISLPAAVS